MKCKICGHATRTINAMRIHYVKKHPQALKRRKTISKLPRMRSVTPNKMTGISYCPHCGAKL